MDLNLKGKVALVTGAARGQGRATAIALAQEGVHICAFDLGEKIEEPGYALGSRHEMDNLTAAINGLGNSARCLPTYGDVRRLKDCQDAANACVEKFGRIDILFNNAGICGYAGAEKMTEDQWDLMIDINLKGAWLMARAVIPFMQKQRSGVIINNSSVGGLRGMNRLSHYAASKWGMTGLTKSWAIELAPFGIRCLSIHPTGVDTPMNDGLAAAEGLTPREVAERSAGNLLPVPWIEASDVAAMVCMLVSEKSRYVTGAQVVIDAGLLTR